MCGFAGEWCAIPRHPDARRARIAQMTASLAHRGPDGAGVWLDGRGTLGLGHRRLAVVDLSEAGHQPMGSRSGRFILVLNGEIYNHLELRAMLARDGVRGWVGVSDTETLLAAIECWGLGVALDRANGMFAFALWDQLEQQLTLVRDRLGEKPLYYGWLGDSFYFCSELRAIEAVASAELSVDEGAAGLFFRYGHVPGPLSVYKGIRKLQAGWVAQVKPEHGREVAPTQYWSLSRRAMELSERPFRGDTVEALDELDRLLKISVGRQVVADVPVGAFLSGGVDSPLLLSYASRLASSPMRTYTVGFGVAALDETTEARAIAAACRTQHTEIVLSDVDALNIARQLSSVYDEPFADASQIPTIAVARAARRDVTVVLSGDGGDEMFGGYPRHTSAAAWSRGLSRYPSWLRQSAGHVLLQAARLSGHVLAAGTPATSPHLRKLVKTGRACVAADLAGLYDEWVIQWRPEDKILGDGMMAEPPSAGVSRHGVGCHDVDRSLMLMDTMSYLVDQVLVKVDRGTMAAGLESRAPFLDRDVVEFSLSLPTKFLLSGGTRKLLPRRLLANRLPMVGASGGKRGFFVPLAEWLRGPLRRWAEELLVDLHRDVLAIDAPLVQRLWREHQAGRADHSTLLWIVLMWRSWSTARRYGGS